MILSAFVFVDPGAAMFAEPFALCASPLISNDFVGTPLGFMAGGVEIALVVHYCAGLNGHAHQNQSKNHPTDPT